MKTHVHGPGCKRRGHHHGGKKDPSSLIPTPRLTEDHACVFHLHQCEADGTIITHCKHNDQDKKAHKCPTCGTFNPRKLRDAQGKAVSFVGIVKVEMQPALGQREGQ